MKTENQQIFFNAPQNLPKHRAASPQHQTSLDAGLHLLQQMLHVGLKKTYHKKKMAYQRMNYWPLICYAARIHFTSTGIENI